MNPLLTCALFTIGLIGDVFWTRWTIAVTAKHGLEAAAWSFLICIPAVLWAPAYVQSRLYVVPFGIGAALGTYLTVVHSKHKGA